MRVAIIDTGTNTFQLLIIEKEGSSFTEVFSTKQPVKLGEAGITSKIISDAAFEHGLNVLKEFKTLCDQHQAPKIIAIGTAALRNATNATAFIDKVKSETGIEIIIISGDVEAELIWNGVKQSVDLKEDKSLLMDIGGGSVEFIIANAEKVFWKQSFDIGGALLLEKFQPSDPVTTDTIKTLETFFDKELLTLYQACQLNMPVQLIGSSGTFDTFTDLIHAQYELPTIPGTTFFEYDMEHYRQVHDQLLKSTHDERLAMKGMTAFRADMIVIASILLTFVLRKLGIKKLTASTYAVKEGILYKLLG